MSSEQSSAKNAMTASRSWALNAFKIAFKVATETGGCSTMPVSTQQPRHQCEHGEQRHVDDAGQRVSLGNVFIDRQAANAQHDGKLHQNQKRQREGSRDNVARSGRSWKPADGEPRGIEDRDEH